ncbi:unnamed protein product [Adineta ricciae]|uniref:NAD(P)(+)--arginine ADP-ribosyltransferase n=1 Tax=Adineta ricciae TaxID=249248 RepID=A0A815V9I6_ADIRI|nr:unnamed protein product [Adineta ricciae]
MSSSTRIEWMWKSNENPWDSSQEEQWSSYSDVETAMIEEAFQNNLSEILLDNYHINLKKSLQISNSNENNQRPIKRIQRNQRLSGGKLRETRFLPTPIHPETPFADQQLFLSYIGEIFSMFQVQDSNALLETNNRQLMIKKAAEGIMNEGKLLGKQKEAEWISEQLIKVINGTDEQIWQCCAHLYTMESFLYQKLNEYMRLCGDKNHKQLWKNKVQIFGPFAFLLQMLNFSKNYQEFYVYRGANLSDELINKFRNNIGAYLMFPAFTSTSRNREKAQQFGNVLFIIHTSSTSGFDISQFSDYPDEEETLLNADFNFFIRSCSFDQKKNKWIIDISSWNDR